MAKKTKKLRRNKEEQQQQEDMILDIDENDLDREWCKQPRLYHTYAVELAYSRKALDEAEAQFKAIKATLDGLIRADPDSFNLEEKPKEAAVAAAIILQDDYINAQKKVIDTQYKVNLLFGMIGALDNKKAALENLVRLHGQDYFSTPRSDAIGQKRLESERSDKVAKKCRKAKRK